jgi:exodeoxyribonuclease VII small subunit
MAKPGLPPEIKALSFEDALEELERIVRQLEDGSAKLDQAIDLYQRGAQLKSHCEQKLAEAKAKVETISLAPDGTVTAEPGDTD